MKWIKKSMSVIAGAAGTGDGEEDHHLTMRSFVDACLSEKAMSPVDSVTVTYKNGDYVTYEYEDDPK